MSNLFSRPFQRGIFLQITLKKTTNHKPHSTKHKTIDKNNNNDNSNENNINNKVYESWRVENVSKSSKVFELNTLLLPMKKMNSQTNSRLKNFLQNWLGIWHLHWIFHFLEVEKDFILNHTNLYSTFSEELSAELIRLDPQG